MSIRTLLLLSAGLLIVACAVASSQPAPSPVPLTPSVPPRLDFSPPASPANPSRAIEIPIPPPPPPAAPAEKTVDDLLTDLERVQAQKAELERKEHELKATIRKKLEKQAERLNKLGVTPKDEKDPARVGRIIIEGSSDPIRVVPRDAKEPNRLAGIIIEDNARKDEKKIRDALGLVPGQVLRNPMLDEARAKLEKAGFRGVKLEVTPNCYVPTMKDVRVKLEVPRAEPAPAPAPRG